MKLYNKRKLQIERIEERRLLAFDVVDSLQAESEPPPINIAPVAAFDLPSTWDRLVPITLDGSRSFDPDNSLGAGITKYVWDIQPQSQFAHYFFQQTPEIEFLFQDYGTLSVSLTVFDGLGGKSSLTQSIEVKQPSIKPIAVIGGRETLGVFRNGLISSGSYDPDDEGRIGNHIASEVWSYERLDVPSNPTPIADTSFFHFTQPGLYEVTLRVVDDEGDTAITSRQFRVQADYINVAIHGWMPLPIDVLNAKGEYREFAGLWDSLVTSKVVPEGSDVWNFAHHWDANLGFTDALVFRTAYEVEKLRLQVLSLVRPDGISEREAERLESLLLSYEAAHRKAQGEAEKAAQDLAKLIAFSIHAHPEENLEITTVINLVGYSRGGYVAARTSQILSDEYFLDVRNVSVLDGFDSAWPGLAGVLGDGSINDSIVSDESRNYLVEDSLIDTVVQLIAGLFDDGNGDPEMSSELSPDEVASMAKATLKWLFPETDWKSPRRNVFAENILIQGADNKARSNHLNVAKMYFGSEPSSSPYPQLIKQSPMFTQQALTGSTAGGEFNERNSVNGPRFDDYLSSKSIERLLKAKSVLKALDQDFAGKEVWINDYLAKFKADGAFEGLAFGNKKLSLVETPVPGIHMPPLEPLSSTFISRNLPELEIRLFASSEAAGARLKVSIDNVLMDGLPLLVAGSQTIRVSLPESQADLRTVTLSWETSARGSVILTGIEHALPAGNASFDVSSRVIHDDLSNIEATAIGNVPVDITLRAFVESNGLAGLQVGDGGDTELNVSINNSLSGVWSIATEKIPLGSQKIFLLQNAGKANELLQVVDVERLSSQASSPFVNKGLIYDVNRDFSTTPLDALLIIDSLNRLSGVTSLSLLQTGFNAGFLLDVNNDLRLTPLDALLVINQLNRSTGEGETNDLTHTFIPWIPPRKKEIDWCFDQEVPGSLAPLSFVNLRNQAPMVKSSASRHIEQSSQASSNH